MERDNESIVLQIQRGEGDRNELLEKLWIDNLQLIRIIIHRMTGLDRNNWSDRQDFEDLEQQAFFGILESVDSYDSSKGNAFMTYAEWKIKKSIMKYYDRSGQALRIPAFMRSRIRAYFQEKKRQQDNGEPATDESIQSALGLSNKSFETVKNAIWKMELKSMDSYLNESDKDSGTIQDMIAGGENTEETGTVSVYESELHETLMASIRTLPELQKKVIIARYYQCMSTERIAQAMNCSQANVTNHIRKAYKRIRIGKYGRELLSFLPERSLLSATRKIRDEIDEFEGLSEQERELLI